VVVFGQAGPIPSNRAFHHHSDLFRWLHNDSASIHGLAFAIRRNIASMISYPKDFCNAKSILDGGLSMSTIRSKAIPRSSMLASTAILFGAIFTVLLVPAYGQQEVDPAWYDPTPDTAMTQPAQAAAAVHSSQPAATVHARPATIQSASRTPAAAKARAKDKQLNQSRRDAARKSFGTPAARNKQQFTVGNSILEARNTAVYRSPDDPISR
jgi:hypothetical protein